MLTVGKTNRIHNLLEKHIRPKLSRQTKVRSDNSAPRLARIIHSADDVLDRFFVCFGWIVGCEEESAIHSPRRRGNVLQKPTDVRVLTTVAKDEQRRPVE